MSEAGFGQYHKSLDTLRDSVLAVRKLRDNGISTMASLIFGLDSDTERVFDTSEEFISRSKAAFFQSCVLTPYQGTLVFENLKREGRILTDDGSKYDTKKVIINPENMSPERLLEGYNAIRKSVYSYNSIISRSLPDLLKRPLEALFYFSLNIGAHYRFRNNPDNRIYRNSSGMPLDFNATKYVTPFRET